MLAISTFVLVSALALCSTLTGAVPASFHQVLANILLLTCRNGDTCTSVGQHFGVSQQALESMNPGINCKFSKALAYIH
ncbi:hypothetical protein BJV78DRAFT_1197337 [Lactifluus subvellereus]|nr:hypothetical protein BJV78DRAFT_1197337 [Lactifluus subvellereus]